MQLSDLQNHFYEKIKCSLDDYLENHGYEYVSPNPLEPESVQLQKIRDRVLESLSYEQFDIRKGTRVVMDFLPQLISGEEWEAMLDELSHIEENVIQYYQENMNLDSKAPDEPHLVMGISENTIEHLKLLMTWLYEKEDFTNSLEVAYFTIAIFPSNIIGWLVAGRCNNRLGDHFLAIRIYERVHKKFPNDPVSRIFCAWTYLVLRDFTRTTIQLEEAEKILSKFPDLREFWMPTIMQIKKWREDES